MKEFQFLNKRVIKLEKQPLFPYTDLNTNNTDMLREILSQSKTARASLAGQQEHLADAQRYLHYVADQALKASGVATRYDEDELAAFSHGFATFEAINMIVKPTDIFDAAAARRAVHRLFVDTTDSIELEFREMIDAREEGRPERPITRDRELVEIELINGHATWAEKQPNTHEVVLTVGERQGESLRALRARTMGAAIAYQLETGALDAAS